MEDVYGVARFVIHTNSPQVEPLQLKPVEVKFLINHALVRLSNCLLNLSISQVGWIEKRESQGEYFFSCAAFQERHCTEHCIWLERVAAAAILDSSLLVFHCDLFRPDHL